MTEERKGQIALLYLKARFKDEGIRLKPDMRRNIGNEAAKIGIPTEEAVEFVEGLVREMVEEVFPPRSFAHVKPDHNREM
jgi:hypothetical protein